MATDWTALRVEYVNGAMQYKELAAKHGLKEGTVRQRANREGWAGARNAVSRDVTRAVTQQATEQKIDILARWNQSTIKEAEAIRLAARSLYMAQDDQGKLRIKARIEPSELNAVAAANAAADRLVRLAVGASTDNASVKTQEIPSSVDDFV